MTRLEELLKIIRGCPDGVTEGALLALGFTRDEIYQPEALALVRVRFDDTGHRKHRFRVKRYFISTERT